MGIVIIEDEIHAALHLVSMIEKYKKETTHSYLDTSYFTNAKEGLHYVLKNKPSIVFLDIHMPELCGRTIAKNIREKLPDTNIIFHTAYPDYAIEAFEIEVTDYLLKPTTPKRLKKAIEKCTLPDSQPIYYIQLFRQLDIYKNQQALDIKWRTKKAKELFTYLIFHQNTLIKKEVLIDLFFENESIEKSYNLLYTTIYQIRKVITEYALPIEIDNQNDMYLIKCDKLFTDIEKWNELFEQRGNQFEVHRKLIGLYNKGLLEDEGYIWSIGEHEKYQMQWITVINELTFHLTDVEEWDEAIQLLLYAQSLYPYHEEFYFSLMKIYQEIGYKHLLEKEFKKLTHIMEEELQEKPSSHIVDWYFSYQ